MKAINFENKVSVKCQNFKFTGAPVFKRKDGNVWIVRKGVVDKCTFYAAHLCEKIDSSNPANEGCSYRWLHGMDTGRSFPNPTKAVEYINWKEERENGQVANR